MKDKVNEVPVVDKEDHQDHAVSVEAEDPQSLEEESERREGYIDNIKKFVSGDGKDKAPRRLEPNKA